MTDTTAVEPRLCPACSLALRLDSRLYHVRCLGPQECDCTHDALREVLLRQASKPAGMVCTCSKAGA
jgi:hypothetical protein